MHKRAGFLAILTMIGMGLITSFAHADDIPAQILTIKDKLITPNEFTASANQKIKIVVKNEDADAAEFESSELHREKVVPAHGEITLYVGPLNTGTYSFFNDFDPNRPKGHIIVQ